MSGNLHRRKGLFSNALQAGGDGKSGSNSYSAWDAGGYQTISGCGRVLRELYLPAQVWQIPSAASGHALAGSPAIVVGGTTVNVPTIAGSSTTCDMLFDATFTAPTDLSTSGSVTPYVELLVTTNVTTASGLGFTLNYNYLNNAACATTSGSVQGVIATAASLGVGGRVSGSLPAMPSFAAGGQLGMLLMRGLTGTCGAGTNFDFVGLRLQYLSDRLGTQSTTG